MQIWQETGIKFFKKIQSNYLSIIVLSHEPRLKGNQLNKSNDHEELGETCYTMWPIFLFCVNSPKECIQVQHVVWTKAQTSLCLAGTQQSYYLAFHDWLELKQRELTLVLKKTVSTIWTKSLLRMLPVLPPGWTKGFGHSHYLLIVKFQLHHYSAKWKRQA